ncbi:HAD family hydrolase, partial [Roseburia hominis]|uniref:HAD family hydrolase n=1 Tax=Roseburia hominis TaxID=301301 RepID=UPI0022E09F04
MIKNVIFDVGQVLVAWEPVEAMRALGMDEETVRAVADATVHTSDWDEADRGALSDEELLTGFIRKAPAYEAQIRNFWEHVDRAIYPFPYVGEWMRTLKDKGYHLYILSNYGAWTYAKTKDQSLGFLKDVDGALFSFEVKQIKPEPEIYHSLLERFHLCAEECVFLDDRQNNVDGAIACGISAIR